MEEGGRLKAGRGWSGLRLVACSSAKHTSKTGVGRRPCRRRRKTEVEGAGKVS